MPKKKEKPLVLWGFHPTHGNVPIKLEDHSRVAMVRRQKEGWTCGAYREGDEPTGLIEMAKRRVAGDA
jgi:hypothetical protein